MKFIALIFLSILTSCKSTSSSQSGLAGVDLETRAEEIRQTIVNDLERTHSDSQGSLWFEAEGKAEKDWIVQSPEDFWGKSLAEIPKAYICEPEDKSCDTSFKRKLCSSDQDCVTSKTSCQLLEASASPTRMAQKMCLSSADRILDRYYRAIVKAEKHIDIVSLSYPTGTFEPMFINALATLAKKANPPTVRILVSGKDVAKLNFMQSPAVEFPGIWKKIEKAYGSPLDYEQLNIDFGYLSATQFRTSGQLVFPTWNHSKIIIADQQYMLQGGHNMWGDDYTGEDPIFDISMEVSGPIARETQKFVNTLWDNIPYHYSNVSQKIDHPMLASIPVRGSKMIGVGRLDFFNNNFFENFLNKPGKNPADEAIKSLIRSSKYEIHFAIQDFFQTIFGERGAAFYAGEPWMADALAEAILNGVKIKVVQSDDTPVLNSYVMLKPKDTLPRLVSLLVEKAKRLPKAKLAGSNLRKFICDSIEYAPWRFTKGVKHWNDKEEIGGHSKLVMVDDSAFYLGSQNMYPAGLQEYGLIVTDPNMTRQLRDQYWIRLWEASSPEKFKCL